MITLGGMGPLRQLESAFVNGAHAWPKAGLGELGPSGGVYRSGGSRDVVLRSKMKRAT